MAQSESSDIDRSPPTHFSKRTAALGTASVHSEEFGQALHYVAHRLVTKECCACGIRFTDDMAQQTCWAFYQWFKPEEALKKEPLYRRKSIVEYVKKIVKSVVHDEHEHNRQHVQYLDVLPPLAVALRPLAERERPRSKMVGKVISQALNQLGEGKAVLKKNLEENQTLATIQQQYARRGQFLTESAFKMRKSRAEQKLFILLLKDERLPKQMRERLAAAVAGDQ